MSDTNGDAPQGFVPKVPLGPMPTSWGVNTMMVGDQRVFLLNFDTPQGHCTFWLDATHAEAFRDQLTEALSGLVLPMARPPGIIRPDGRN